MEKPDHAKHITRKMEKTKTQNILEKELNDMDWAHDRTTESLN